MKEYFVLCKETCPYCLGSKLILDKKGYKVRLKCEKCDESGIFTHEVNIKDVPRFNPSYCPEQRTM